MTDERRKVKHWLVETGKSFRELARASRLTETTVHNILSGRTHGRASRQRLTDALQFELFKGVLPSERAFVFPPGTEFSFEGHEANAHELLAELPDNLELRGSTLVVLKPTVFVISTDGRSSHTQHIFGTKKYQMNHAGRAAAIQQGRRPPRLLTTDHSIKI